MNARKIKNIFILLLVLYGAIAWVISGAGDTLFEHLHLELDTGNGMLSGIFAIFIWTTAHLKKEWKLRPYLAVAFAFAAGAEILHALIGVEWTGSFFWINAASNTLRPATWPPSTYLFPVALGWILWIRKKEAPVSTPAFAAQLAVFAVLLYAIFVNIPSYKAIGFLGVHRPFQIPVLVLLAGVGHAFWRRRAEDPLFEPLVYCITFLFISDSFMLFSTSPHEKWTMIAHTGKFAAYLLMHISMMELAMDDLVARNRAEKALLAESEKLQQSHKLLTDLSAQVPGVMYQFRQYPDGRSCFPFASREISNICEDSLDQVCEDASAVFSHVHPDDIEEISASTRESARTLQLRHHEYRVVLPKQGVRWRLCNARPQKLEDGSILWHGFITDITERKRAEEALHASEERWRFALEGAGDGVWEWNLPTREMIISKVGKAMFGFAEDEIGNDLEEWQARIHPDDMAHLEEDTLAYLHSNDTYFSTEYRLRCKDGSWKWVHVRGMAMNRAANGHVLRMIGTHSDITERKRVEELLRKSSEEIADLYNHAPCGYHSLDEDGVIRLINDTELAWLGYTRDEVAGKMKWPDLVTPASLQIFHATFPQLKERGSVSNLEVEMVRKDGTVFAGLINATAVYDSGGSFVASRSTVFDITERKRLERQLSRRLRHMDVMERITRIGLDSATVEEMLEKVLDEMLAVFDADRTWFLYPCDPDALSWSVPIERTRPEWPGAFASSMVIPMTPEVAGVFREVLASAKPLPYGPTAPRGVPAAIAGPFSVRSQIQMALRPRTGSPWTMGLHHCAQARAYDENDLLLFNDIGQRVADALSSMIILKNLRESEDRFRLIMETIDEVSWMADVPINRMYYISPSYERVWGRTTKSLYENPRSFIEAIHPEDKERVLSSFDARRDGQPFSHEYRIIRPDGTIRWVWDRGFPVHDRTGKATRYAGVAQDITDRKLAGDALRASEQRYRFLVESSPYCIHEIDLEGRLLSMNKAGLDMLGLQDVGEICGVPYLDSVSPQDAGRVGGLLHDAITNGATSHFGFTAAGEALLYFKSCFIPLKDASGKVVKLMGITEDITERRLAEEKLIESKANLQAILDNFPYIAWLKDTKGRFIAVNEPFFKSTRQKRRQDVLGKTDFDLWPKKLAEKYRTGDVDVMSTHRKMLTEELAVTENGEIHWVETFKAPIMGENGQLLGTTGFARDINERKEFEEALKRSNAELEQFNYAVSHDMRQPLRMISSYLQLIEMELGGRLDEEKRAYFNHAIEGAKRIDQMLVALLEYSRVGRMGDPLDWIESRMVLDEALQYLQPAIAEAQAGLNIGGEWPRIFASHDEIQRLFQNLIGNAIKFRIAGRQPEIHINSRIDRDKWRWSIADNGVGIIPDQIKRLFQVFQRLQLRTAYEGNGVGLALCRKIVEHHKGRIWAESEGEGKGSTFHVVLPVLGEESAPARKKDA